MRVQVRLAADRDAPAQRPRQQRAVWPPQRPPQSQPVHSAAHRTSAQRRQRQRRGVVLAAPAPPRVLQRATRTAFARDRRLVLRVAVSQLRPACALEVSTGRARRTRGAAQVVLRLLRPRQCSGWRAVRRAARQPLPRGRARLRRRLRLGGPTAVPIAETPTARLVASAALRRSEAAAAAAAAVAAWAVQPAGALAAVRPHARLSLVRRPVQLLGAAGSVAAAGR